MKYFKNLNWEWLYMWMNLENKLRLENAILYAAKLLWTVSPEIQKNLRKYKDWLMKEVMQKDKTILEQQLK